jgi:hypothetical protein
MMLPVKYKSYLTSMTKSDYLTMRQPYIAGSLLLGSLLLSALVLPPVFAQSADKITLPDLGTPAANTAVVQPNINAQSAGFSYRDNINGKILSITPQYTQQGGAAIGGSLASPISKNMAVGILLTAGSDKNEWLLNTGFDLTSNQRFIFSLGQLRQKLDFNFSSGSQKATIRQDNIAASYQYFLGKDWLNAAEVNGYISNTPRISLGEKTYFTDTTSLYELWSDPRRIAGGRVSGVQGRLVFTPTSRTTLKVGLGAERLTYDYLTGNQSTNRATGSAELNQRLDNGFNFHTSANAAAAQNRYALGLGKSFSGGSQLGIDLVTIKGHNNTFNDNQLLLSYTQSFGGNHASAFGSNLALNNVDASGAPMNQAPANTAALNPSANTWASSLVEQVSRRPNYLPAQVVAKVDATATPTRLIAIDKTAAPAGSSINTATGAITAPTVTAVSGIAGITKNAVAFTNAGQFALSGNNLVVNPSLITQPAVGVIDTYIVTMNDTTGGGTTLATVVVSHGSVKINSITFSSGKITPTLAGFGLSAASVAINATAPTVIPPTSASSGAIIYSSATPSVATITSAGVITLVGTGTTVITATQMANGNYSRTTSTTTLTVTAAAPTLTGFGLSAASVAFGTTAPTITAPTSASSGAITYSSATPSVATITSAGVITLVGTGTTVITATQAATGNYGSATTTTTLTVTGATPTLSGFSLSSTSVAFGATAPTIIAPTSASSGAITYSSGTLGTATITSSGVITLVGVGSTVITATQAANGNYASSSPTGTTLTVTPATPTLSGLSLSAASVALNATAPTIVAPTSASSGAITYSSGDTAVATITSGGVITLVGTGSTVITATQAANGNYASATTTTTLTVTAAVGPPAGYIVSGGLTWAPVNTTANWSTASSTCAASTDLGYAAGTWRQPTSAELSALYTASSSGGVSPATWPPTGWMLLSTWSETTGGVGHLLVNLGGGGVVDWYGNSYPGYVSCVH